MVAYQLHAMKINTLFEWLSGTEEKEGEKGEDTEDGDEDEEMEGEEGDESQEDADKEGEVRITHFCS